jgi:hypothetical protein
MAMSIAHQEYRNLQLTTNQAGYHNANTAFKIQQHTSMVLANLATATAADCTAVASLTTTISTITLELAEATNKLSQARAKILALQVKLATAKCSNTHDQRPPCVYQPNNNYCWTHGYKVAGKHTSVTCTRPREGHQRDATKCNNMGGLQQGKD